MLKIFHLAARLYTPQIRATGFRTSKPPN